VETLGPEARRIRYGHNNIVPLVMASATQTKLSMRNCK